MLPLILSDALFPMCILSQALNIALKVAVAARKIYMTTAQHGTDIAIMPMFGSQTEGTQQGATKPQVGMLQLSALP
jgi:hypothetical protein